jgi:hypothetical protein
MEIGPHSEFFERSPRSKKTQFIKKLKKEQQKPHHPGQHKTK